MCRLGMSHKITTNQVYRSPAYAFCLESGSMMNTNTDLVFFAILEAIKQLGMVIQKMNIQINDMRL